MTLGARVRENRLRQKMTQRQLAEEINCSHSFISTVERDKRNPRTAPLVDIAAALRVSIDYLLTGKSTNSSICSEVVIPTNLDKAAVELKLSYRETIELLDVYDVIMIRITSRSNRTAMVLTVKEWVLLYNTIKEII